MSGQTVSTSAAPDAGAQMALIGHGSQVVEVTADHKYLLNEEELKRVLMREEIKELPVVMVSVAGAFRAGKSFLLNFFLRYLTSSKEAQANGSWLAENSKRLDGFSWRGGSKRNTTGILIWSEPVICTTASGEKVAVLLMDTQGTFDSTSTVRDCSTIFALSTLLSSVQIYNLSQNIQEDDLQYLQLFTEYGRLTKDQKTGKAFQTLQFLVRDWPFKWEHPYGPVGGNDLLEDRLTIHPNMSKELKDLRIHIRASFEKISCYLMPHPGFEVLNPDFKGDIADIAPKFREHLALLITSLFRPENLQPKIVNGKKVRSKELFTYFQTYVKVFNSDKIPTPTSILVATAEAGFLTAVHDGLELYVAEMERDCGEKVPAVSPADVKFLHDRSKKLSLDTFNSEKKMGSKESADKYYAMLEKDIQSRLEQFVNCNILKQHKVLESAGEAYKNIISTMSKDGLFCVHPADLEAIHESAKAAALKTYDDAQKRYIDKTNEARGQLERSLDRKYQVLKHDNDASNKLVIREVYMKYWEDMANKVSGHTLEKADFEKLHQEHLSLALEAFKNRRGHPDNYNDDVFKSELVNTITQHYIDLKTLNESNLDEDAKKRMRDAVSKYDLLMDRAWDHRKECLHPEEFEAEHKKAMCKAVEIYRPGKHCTSGDFTSTDENDISFKNILERRYTGHKSENRDANKSAIASAHAVFYDTFEKLNEPSWWWYVTGVPFISRGISNLTLNYHRKARAEAIKYFYTKRRNAGPQATDTFLFELIKEIDDANNWNRFLHEKLPGLWKVLNGVDY